MLFRSPIRSGIKVRGIAKCPSGIKSENVKPLPLAAIQLRSSRPRPALCSSATSSNGLVSRRPKRSVLVEPVLSTTSNPHLIPKSLNNCAISPWDRGALGGFGHLVLDILSTVGHEPNLGRRLSWPKSSQSTFTPRQARSQISMPEIGRAHV